MFSKGASGGSEKSVDRRHDLFNGEVFYSSLVKHRALLGKREEDIGRSRLRYQHYSGSGERRKMHRARVPADEHPQAREHCKKSDQRELVNNRCRIAELLVETRAQIALLGSGED